MRFRYFFVLLAGFNFTLPNYVQAADQVASLPSYYSKDTRALTLPEAEKKFPEENAVHQQAQVSENFLAKADPLQMIRESEADDEAVLHSEFPSFHFDPLLTRSGEVKISDHESIMFDNNTVIAHSYGNKVSLNLEDQKLLCVTYAGYVLGPFIPSQDYMDVYFETLQSIQDLVSKVMEQKKKEEAPNDAYLIGLAEARQTLDEFKIEAEQVKIESKENDLKRQLQEIIIRYYQGDMPEYIELKFQEKKDFEKPHWEAVMVFDVPFKSESTQRRVFKLETIREEFAVIEIQDRSSEDQLLLQETYDYDPTFTLRSHRIKTFYTEGGLKSDHDIRYEEGIKSVRYYKEYNKHGKRKRFLRETFFQDGNTQTSSDYQYLVGKKYNYKFNSDGRVIHSYTEPLTASLS